MTNALPRSTYRLQFTPNFTFKEAHSILHYLRDLGISHVYASPIAQSRKGSTNGYDVCNPREVNPQLGTFDDLVGLMSRVRDLGMGWIQDIVPNHMAFSDENPLLMDVLEHGSESRFFEFFDINWEHFNDNLRGRVISPFLGKPLGDCLNDGELKVIYDDRGLGVRYYEHRYPIKPESYLQVLGGNLPALREKLSTQSSIYVRFTGILYTMRNLPDYNERVERAAQSEMALLVLRELYEENSIIRHHMEKQIERFNGSHAHPERITALYRLLSEQHYRLCFWRVAAEEINYRRFFTISELIALRIELEPVFNYTHALWADLHSRGLLHGLRIDHIDGLFNPAEYLERLRLRFPGSYIIVEKILEKNETILSSWPIHGDTGYQYLNYLNGIFCASQNARVFDKIYTRFTGYKIQVNALKIDRKRLIINKHMAGDIDNLVRLIFENADKDMMGSDVTFQALRTAMVEVLTHFPVYRTYIDQTHFDNVSKKLLRKTLLSASRMQPEFEYEYRFIQSFLMLTDSSTPPSTEDKAERRRAIMRFQQFTGPLMAKGYEDTFLYIYNRLVSLNEVGGWPDSFGNSLDEFHNYVLSRKNDRPWTMNTSSTHDTKRGEDTRARLNVLSEIPTEWQDITLKWKQINAPHKSRVRGSMAPDLNDEYLLYQTLAGSCPLSLSDLEGYKSRISQYMLKAIREAKVHTAWIKPDEKYENVSFSFIEKILSPKNQPFLESLVPFVQYISWYGNLNSLSQVTTKIMSPGVADIYQGTEFWDYSLVDPDNRREVNYSSRMDHLKSMGNRLMNPDGELLETLLANPADGHIKQFVIARLLQLRKDRHDLFSHGQYIPLSCSGEHAPHAIAFAIKDDHHSVLSLSPRWCASLVKQGSYPVGPQVWGDTRLHLPSLGIMEGTSYRNIFTGAVIFIGEATPIAQILAGFPVAVLSSVA